MPVQSPRTERPIIELFLSAYEHDTWQGASLDWVEEKQNGAVEVVAARTDGISLALEHTLIQPFVGEKFDSEAFMTAFGRIEKNPALVVPERNLEVIVPVHAIPNGYNWDEVGKGLLTWLLVNHAGAPAVGVTHHVIQTGSKSKNRELLLRITLRSGTMEGTAGNCLISRDKMPGDLETIVEKALKTKLPKLIKTAADRRVLLLERDQVGLGDGQIYDEIVKLSPKFPDIAKINEIWFVNTSILESEGWVCFSLMDRSGLVESLTFENGVLKSRRDIRLHLEPTRREF
jgi:hypothetical protein